MITKDDVRYIASLARLHIPEEKLDGFTKQLEGILHYVEKLNKLDVGHVKPTSHVLQLENVYRDDIVKPSLPLTETLKIAVEQDNGSFKVPKVIE